MAAMRELAQDASTQLESTLTRIARLVFPGKRPINEEIYV
jgi:hypothetical protein